MNPVDSTTQVLSHARKTSRVRKCGVCVGLVLCLQHVSPQEDQDWDWSEWKSEKVMEWDGRSEAGSHAWPRWTWSSWRECRNNPWNEMRSMRIEGYEEAPPMFPESVLVLFFHKRVSWWQERGRNMIWAAKGKRDQLDQVEPAMKIQFPDDEIRHHDDRTGTYHKNILGVPSMRTTAICQEMKKR